MTKRKEKTKIGETKIKRLWPRDVLSVTPGWKINKKRYALFARACKNQNTNMLPVVNDFLDSYIADVYGEEIVERLKNDIDKDRREYLAKRND